MKCCKFAFSSCSFSYLYILFSIILYFLKSCVLSFSELSSTKKINIFGIEPVLIKHGLMQLLIEYIGYIIFGGIFLYIFRLRKIVKNQIKENQANNTQFRAFKSLLIICCL